MRQGAGCDNCSSGKWISVDGDGLDLNAFLWSAFLVDLELLNVIEHLKALDYFAEDGVLAIQMGCRGKGDEELTAIGIGTLVCHADYTSSIMSERRPDLVLEQLIGGVVDGRGRLGFGIGCRATRLDDEVRNETMERTAVVKVRSAKG